MSIWQAILLGLVQGLTEFIPISSTAHLTIAGKLMGLINAEHPEQWTAFMAVIQLGKLVAVIVYFWHDLINIIRGFILTNVALIATAMTSQGRARGSVGW
jgi:undecaprenyl-diphosphatase